MKPRRPAWRHGLAPGLLALAAGGLALVLPLPFPQVLTQLSYELPYLVHPRERIEDVVMVYMDVPSEERLGQSRWERWDRALHARLIRTLSAAGARAIAFDVVFQRGTNDAANAELVAAARASGRVTVAAMKGAEVHEGRVIGFTLLQPFPELADVTTWGMAEAADDTGTIREHVRDLEFQIPSMAWRVASQTAPPAASAPGTTPFARRWVRYYGPPGTIPHVSYADALDPAFPATATFSNRVVFVGASWVAGFSGGRGADDYRSPFTLWSERRMAGVEVCATTYRNLVRRDWWNRLSPAAEAAWIALTGLLAGFGLARLRPIPAALVATAAATSLVALGMALPWLTSFWFPWMIIVALQLPVAAAVASLLHTRRLHREHRALEQTFALTSGASISSPSPDVGTPMAQPPTTAAVPRATSTAMRPAPPTASTTSSAPLASSAPVARDHGAAGLGTPMVPDHELLRRIGRGGYGEVWLARDILGQHHAVKIVRPAPDSAGRATPATTAAAAEPLEREFHGLQRFTPLSRRHPGLVHILQVGRLDAAGSLYYVMELADDAQGGSFQPDTYVPRTLAADLRARGALPLSECLELGVQLADALGFLHAHGLVHRDLKPSNIIFVRGLPKLADVGLVTAMAPASPRDLTDPAAVADAAARLGTEGYIAPEGPGQPAADLYSLGKVLYQMAFGLEARRFPEVPVSLITDAAEEPRRALNRLLLQVCAQQPSARPASAGQLAQALAALREPNPSRPVTKP